MLEKSVIITLIVWCIHSVFWPSMLLGSVSRWLSTWIPTKLQFPIYACALCMTPYYGSAAYWLIWANGWQEWIVVIMGAMGLSAIIISFLPKD